MIGTITTTRKHRRSLAGAALFVAFSVAVPRHALADSTPWAPADSYRAMLGIMVALSSQQLALASNKDHAANMHSGKKPGANCDGFDRDSKASKECIAGQAHSNHADGKAMGHQN